jgi:hypothetical protein
MLGDAVGMENPLPEIWDNQTTFFVSECFQTSFAQFKAM